MGGRSSKAPAPIFLTDQTIDIKTDYIIKATQIYIDREVFSLEKSERELLNQKYTTEGQRTLDNMMFREEVMQNAVLVRKVVALKKTVHFVKF